MRRDVLRALFFPPAVVEAAARELGLPIAALHWRYAQPGDPDLYRSVRHVHEALEGDATPLERETRIAHLLHRLIGEFCDGTPRPPSGGAEPESVRRARALLDAHWGEQVLLDDLVAVAGTGRFRLLRDFRAVVGLPPHAYQIRLRITRAMRLIRTGVPLGDVALETGFTDQSHLTRHFTRALGVSPGRYRAGVR